MSDEQELRERFELDAARINFRFQWHEFCYNLIHETRFIPNPKDKAFIDETVELIIKNFTVDLPVETSFYRARVIPVEDMSVQEYWETAQGQIPALNIRKSPIRGYSDLSDVGIPPADKAGVNRANPKGIPYLYAADNIYTAVSEVRPSILECINVVEFVNLSPIKVIKLPRGENDFNSMITTQDKGLKSFLRAIAKTLSSEFSRPVRRNDAELEYLPTQYIVNAIRAADSSIQGIAYPSFQSHVGMNFVIFSQDDLKLQEKPERIIRAQNVTYDCCDLNNLSEKITPEQIDYNSALTDEKVDKMKQQIIAYTEQLKAEKIK